MRLNIEKKKILYAFGCSHRRNTVERLKWLAALAVDAETKRMILMLARKFDRENAGGWYRCFYKQLRLEMGVYFLAGKVMHMAERSTDGKDIYGEAD